jgi:Acetyltransferase (GNAT) family
MLAGILRSLTDKCLDRYCDDCTAICKHRLLDDETDCMQLKTRGRFPLIGYIDGERYTFLSDPESVMPQLRNTPIDLFTFLEKPGESADFRYPSEEDQFAVLQMSDYEQWLKLVGQKTRNLVRKAEKFGVTVTESALTDEVILAIRDAYNETPVRQGKPYHHYGTDEAHVRERFSTFSDRSILLAARHEGNIVGTARMIVDNSGDFAGIIHFLSLMSYRDKSVNNALMSACVKTCIDRRIKQVVYERLTYGNKGVDALANFKRHNGFTAVPVKRYWIPMTRVGSVAMKLGLHRSLRSYVPESIASPLRKLRTSVSATLIYRPPSQ